MSKNINIEELQAILIEAGLDSKTRSTVLKTAEELVQEKKAEKEETKLPKQKKQFVVVVKTTADLKGHEIVSSVFQMSESEDANTLVERLQKAAKIQSSTAKRKKFILDKFSDIILHLKPKLAKTEGVQIKTKDWVHTIVLDSKLD
jgi:2-iminoacetate synthase ThiH